MKVHIFIEENYYTYSLLELLTNNIDFSDQIIIFRKFSSIKSFPAKNKVVHSGKISELIQLKKVLLESEKIIFHSFPSGYDLLFWYFNKSFFKKSIWIYWGADVYSYRNKFKNIKQLLYHILRKRIIPIIPDIGGFLKGDYEFIKKVYSSNAKYHKVIYPIPTNFTLCDSLIERNSKQERSSITIMIGNSGSETNMHIEAFQMIKRFKNEDIRIICPLSYGASETKYSKKVRYTGNLIFGEKFTTLDHFISIDEYLKMLSEVDIAIMNHNRQQGLGNIISLLYLGKKVFMRSETTSFKYFQVSGINVYRTHDINKMEYKEFIAFTNEAALNNSHILLNEFSEESYLKMWKSILELK